MGFKYCRLPAQLLKIKYPKTIWCFKFQVKENPVMYFGNKMVHDPTSLIN